MKNLLNDMDEYSSSMEELLQNIEEKLKEILHIDKLMTTKGIGLVTVNDYTLQRWGIW